jgi:hypothetical protein
VGGADYRVRGYEWAVLAILFLVIIAGFLIVHELTELACGVAVMREQMRALQNQVDAPAEEPCRVRVNVKNTTNVNCDR